MRFADDLDLLGGARPPAWWSWALLAAGAVALCAAGNVYQKADSALDHEQGRLAQAQRRLSQQQNAADAQAQRAALDAVDRQSAQARNQQLHDAADVVSALQHPWGEVLSGIELSSDPDQGQALLALRHSATDREVLIDAAVKDDDAALKLVDALAAQTDVFEEASLRSRETLAQPQGALTVHVQISASLKAASPVIAENTRGRS